MMNKADEIAEGATAVIWLVALQFPLFGWRSYSARSLAGGATVPVVWLGKLHGWVITGCLGGQIFE